MLEKSRTSDKEMYCTYFRRHSYNQNYNWFPIPLNPTISLCSLKIKDNICIIPENKPKLHIYIYEKNRMKNRPKKRKISFPSEFDVSPSPPP